MKKTIFAALMLLSCASAKAQPYVDINNPSSTLGQTPGDVYVNVYAVSPGCGEVIDYTVPVVVMPSATTYSLDLSLGSTWNSGFVPGAYDIAYATVSRDPSCAPTIATWGAYNATSSWPTDYYWEEVKVGNPFCGYKDYAGFIISLIGGGTCNGYIDGEYHQVMMTFPGGTTLAQIDIIGDPAR
jgi:hypothetical protein